jgi:tetratricopeptide (TPR) repeat protein
MIIISAADSVDKGKAFEEFIAILLSKLGYEIRNVRVRKAGRELDIKASSKVTGAPLLAECKALSRTLTGPSLSKFYGIYDHEYRKPTHGLIGLLISLSGFNSEAIEYYEEKDEEVQGRFRIIGPDQILKLAVEADLVSDDLTVQHVATKSWPHDLDKTLLIITKSQLYRVQILKRNGKVTHFLAYRPKCEDPTAYEVERLRKNVRILQKLEFFNLVARKETLLALSQLENPVSFDRLQDITKQSAVTVRTELSYLKDRNLIEEPREDHFTPVYDIRAFAEISKELLTSSYRYEFLKSNYFKKMNNQVLSQYCLSRRFLEAKQDDEHKLLNSLFRFSPSALNQALFGETDRYRVTYEHAAKIGADSTRISKIVKSNFYGELIPNLLRDLHEKDNVLIRELHPIVGLKEEHRVVLANTLETVFDITSGGVFAFMKAGEDLKAGQLVSTDHRTAFNSSMTTFNLTSDPQCIEEMKGIYAKLIEEGIDSNQLAIMANNIGVCLMALQKWPDAKHWLSQGLSHSDVLPQLHGNLARVLEQLGDSVGASASLQKAKELDPNYEVKPRADSMK